MFKKDKLLHLLEREKMPLLRLFCGSSLEKCQLISVELWIDPPGIECNTKTQAVLSQFWCPLQITQLQVKTST